MDIIIRPAETSDFDSVESGSGFACELAALYLQRK